MLGRSKWSAAAQQLEQGAAERIDVGADIDAAAVGHLLGRHVIGCAQRLTGGGHAGLFDFVPLPPRQPKVQQFYIAAAAEHDVRRFDVAVHKPLLASVGEGHGYLTDDLAGVGDRQRPDTLDELTQVQSVDVFGDENRGAIDVAGIVGGDDVRVAESADGPHFGFEPLPHPRIGQAVSGQQFDRDFTAEFRVPGEKHAAHAAPAQRTHDFIFADADRQRRLSVADGFIADFARVGQRQGGERFGQRRLTAGLGIVWGRVIRVAECGDERILVVSNRFQVRLTALAVADVVQERVALVLAQPPERKRLQLLRCRAVGRDHHGWLQGSDPA